MESHIGIKEEQRQKVALTLSTLLADEFILYTKTRNAHWNVEGNDFSAKHIFFEEQYLILDKTMDSVAERIRHIGHYAPGTLGQLLQLTHLTERSKNGNSSGDYIRELLQDQESIITFLRENIKPATELYHDAGTSDFLSGLLKEHEKMAWMLRSHIS